MHNIAIVEVLNSFCQLQHYALDLGQGKVLGPGLLGAKNARTCLHLLNQVCQVGLAILKAQEDALLLVAHNNIVQFYDIRVHQLL